MFKVTYLVSNRARIQIKCCQIQWSFLCAYLHFSPAFNTINNFHLLEILSSWPQNAMLSRFITSSLATTSWPPLLNLSLLPDLQILGSSDSSQRSLRLTLFLDYFIHSRGFKQYHMLMTPRYVSLALIYMNFRYEYLILSFYFLTSPPKHLKKHCKLNVSKEEIKNKSRYFSTQIYFLPPKQIEIAPHLSVSSTTTLTQVLSISHLEYATASLLLLNLL